MVKKTEPVLTRSLAQTTTPRDMPLQAAVHQQPVCTRPISTMGAPKASWQYASSSTTRTGAEFETAHNATTAQCSIPLAADHARLSTVQGHRATRDGRFPVTRNNNFQNLKQSERRTGGALDLHACIASAWRPLTSGPSRDPPVESGG